jgi:hypothetical protein
MAFWTTSLLMLVLVPAYKAQSLSAMSLICRALAEPAERVALIRIPAATAMPKADFRAVLPSAALGRTGRLGRHFV